MGEKVAILVIHGIGQQKPYETLDKFGRNLIASLDDTGQSWTITPQLDQVPDPTHVSQCWTRASYILTPPNGVDVRFTSDPNACIDELSLYEYYWAPVTQGKITYTGSLLFLIKAGLQPFLYLASNVNAIAHTDGRKTARRRIPVIIAKEFWRQACLFVPLLLFFAALLDWLKTATSESLQQLIHFDGSTVAVLTILAIRYLYLYTSANALWLSFKAKSGWQIKWAWRTLLIIAVLFHLIAVPLLLAPAVHLAVSCGVHLAHLCPLLPRLLGHWAGPVTLFADQISFPYAESRCIRLAALAFLNPGLRQYTVRFLTILLALFVRFILIDYVGDVAVYANTSQFSQSYAVRSQIIDECTAALSAILMQTGTGPDRTPVPKYDRVLIAAHSLGSVIAYDTMNNLLDIARSADPTKADTFQPRHLDPLRGLVTFGCPLNKIYYFFREQDPPQQVLRDQTLDLLYGFRSAVPTVVGSSSLQFQPVPAWDPAERALASGFRWINAYCLQDPVSGKIVFYKLEDADQQRFKGFFRYPPIVAHLRYWEDPNFYAFFRKNLL
jgi:hypothetical protein